MIEIKMHGSVSCARCKRRLSDPVSVQRQLGPQCWRSSGGGSFDGDLDASPEEWERREVLLRDASGEVDFGANWRYIDPDPSMALQLPWHLRVTVRYRDGAFEAYGLADWGPDQRELVYHRSLDLKSAYTAAVSAGPASTARVHQHLQARQRAGKGGRAT